MAIEERKGLEMGYQEMGDINMRAMQEAVWPIPLDLIDRVLKSGTKISYNPENGRIRFTGGDWALVKEALALWDR